MRNDSAKAEKIMVNSQIYVAKRGLSKKTHLTTAKALLSIAKKAVAQNNTQSKTG